MKILVNRSDAIGDTILTLPVGKLIKEMYPESHLIYLVSEKSKDLFEFTPYVDEVWVMNNTQSKFKRILHFLKISRKVKIDKYLYVGGSHIPSLILFFKRTKIRGGLKSRWPSYFFLNKPVRQKRSIVEMHESDYNLNLLSSFGIDYPVDLRNGLGPSLEVKLLDARNAMIELRDEIIESGVEFKDEFVVIHPGMTGHTLNWSPRNYARLIDRIEGKVPEKYLFIISHTVADRLQIAKFKDELSMVRNDSLTKRIFYLDGGKRGLSNYIKVIKNASLFVGPSTGNTHIANSIGVKQVGLYSPIKIQSALRWGPYHRVPSSCRVIVPDVVCGEQLKCAGTACTYFKCMAKVEVEEVSNEVLELLGEKQA